MQNKESFDDHDYSDAASPLKRVVVDVLFVGSHYLSVIIVIATTTICVVLGIMMMEPANAFIANLYDNLEPALD